MKRNKFSKNKIILGCGLLTVISALGIGFSSWVISGSTTDSLETGISASIGVIEDNSLSAEIISGDNSTIRFDSLSNELCTGGVITNGDGEVAKMDFTISYKITTGTKFTTNNVEVDFTFGGGTSDFISKLNGTTQYIDTTCINNSSITLNGTTTSIGASGDAVYSTISYESTNLVANISTTFTFKWGSAFNNENPCLASDQSVVTTLKNFQTAFSGISNKLIDLTITSSLVS